jgi:hypothetical protein
MTFHTCSSPAPTPVKPLPAPTILSQESVHTTLSITHHTRKRPSIGPRTTHGPHFSLGFFSRLMRLVWIGGKLVLGCSVWWNWSFPKLFFSLTTALPYLICPKRLTIKALKRLNHHTKLRLLTRQPTQQVSQIIILNLQAINLLS